MTGRPRDWSPVADTDPVPGDPDRVAALGKELRKTADELKRQVRNLRALAELESWDSEAGRKYRKKAKHSLGKLEAAHKRYDTAADAMGTRVDDVGDRYEDKLHAKPKNYATDLNRAQEIADEARREGRDAGDRKTSSQKELNHQHKEAGKHKKKELESKHSAAHGDIEAARDKIEKAKAIRDAAAKRARDSINEVVDNDSLKDNFWKSLIADIADVTSWIATVCGVLSMLVGWIPIIGQALAGVLGAIAMVATLVNVACTLIQYIQGDAGLMDLGMAALGFLMMGVGKAFGKVAGKFVGKLLPRITRASSRSARSPSKLAKLDRQKLNKLSGANPRLTRQDYVQSLKEPFTDVTTLRGLKGTWGDLKTLKPGGGNYRAAVNTLRERGGLMRGTLRSMSLADPGVASDLKTAKISAKGLDANLPALETLSQKATRLTVTGSAITLGGLALDSNVDPAAG